MKAILSLVTWIACPGSARAAGAAYAPAGDVRNGPDRTPGSGAGPVVAPDATLKLARFDWSKARSGTPPAISLFSPSRETRVEMAELRAFAAFAPSAIPPTNNVGQSGANGSL
jgi:hypothetical protein